MALMFDLIGREGKTAIGLVFSIIWNDFIYGRSIDHNSSTLSVKGKPVFAVILLLASSFELLKAMDFLRKLPSNTLCGISNQILVFIRHSFCSYLTVIREQ